MLVSDWSSEVSSSDLGPPLWLHRRIPTVRVPGLDAADSRNQQRGSRVLPVQAASTALFVSSREIITSRTHRSETVPPARRATRRRVTPRYRGAPNERKSVRVGNRASRWVKARG